jgi:hypothetical protein
MEAAWVAMALWHPVALAVLICAVFLSSFVLNSSMGSVPITRMRLARGYGAAILVCIVVAAISSYIPQQEAQQRWGVSPERYWDAVLGEFSILATVLTYIAVFCIAVVGSPVVFALARRGYDSIPFVLAASVLISLLVVAAMAAVSAPGPAFGRDVVLVVGIHGLLALAFGIGVGLPWRRRTTS